MVLKVLSSGSQGNCYLLETDTECLILDAGIPIKDIKRGLDFNVSKVVGVLVTHFHTDHSKSVKDFRNMGILVFAPYEDDEIKRCRKQFGNFIVTPFELPHNGVLNAGFGIECEDQKILYMTDFEYCKYTFKKQRVNHILIECNYQDELVNKDLPQFEHKILGHCSLETCKKFIDTNKSSDLRNVILIHMGQETANPTDCIDEIKKVAGYGVNVDYARAGLEVEFNRELF